ncbi:MAG: YcjX family protein [Pseudomonadota bacterium]
MRIGDWTDDLLNGAEQAWRNVDELFEPVMRLGVTGLSGAGKTVFITALVASLLRRGRLRLLSAESENRIAAAMLRPQPDPDVPRFAFEDHLTALTGTPPEWPESTRQISQLRLSLKVRPSGLFSILSGIRTVHLDIVDYPGEWLLDLPLLEKTYAMWSGEALTAARSPARHTHGSGYLSAIALIDGKTLHEESLAAGLARSFRDYLNGCRASGLSALAPGRFLMPGDLDGSPALTFAPLPKPERAAHRSLYRQMEERYEAYKRVVVKPFFRNHFARLDRQVVLVDALGALAGGPRALGDLTAAMAETLTCFRHGGSSWLDRIIGGRKIDRILFAASKADHLHHEQHPRLTQLVEAMLAEATRQAAFNGAQTAAMSIAAIRASGEQTVTRDGVDIGLVRGTRASDGKDVALFPGELPADMATLLADASASAPGDACELWAGGSEFARPVFSPPHWESGPKDGPPHIRLDRALEFLIGDKLG